MFIPVTKIDEEQRMVYGCAADETPDSQDEIFDYAGNAPLWRDWSERFSKITDGKSLGNVREQHDPKRAVGKLMQFEMDDSSKTMMVGAKVIDDAAWEKARSGVFTGFSVGGHYVSKTADSKNPKLKRVVIRPSEISLVDSGANPSATFSVVKMDGIVEDRAFKIAARPDTSPKRGKEEYGNVDFADEKNKKYPIDTAEHIRAAWNYIHKEKNRSEYSAADASAIEKKIEAAWREKIDPKGPPAAQASSKKSIHRGNARKGMWDVGSLANILQSLSNILQSVTAEAEYEGDGSTVPAQLQKNISDLSDTFLAMAQEETDEIVESNTPHIQE